MSIEKTLGADILIVPLPTIGTVKLASVEMLPIPLVAAVVVPKFTIPDRCWDVPAPITSVSTMKATGVAEAAFVGEVSDHRGTPPKDTERVKVLVPTVLM